jgi:hypothetical protein
MPKYKVNDPLRHNGKRYKPGTDNDTVEMSEAEAAKVRPGVLRLVDDSAAKAAAEKAAAEKAAAEKAAADKADAEKADAEKADAEKAAEQKNNPASEAQAAGDQEEKAEGAGAPAAAGTAAQPAGKKKGAK